MFIFEYLARNGVKSICGVNSAVHSDTVVVVITDLPHNPGMSVTNAIEDIASMVKARYLADLPAEMIRWIEHTPPRNGSDRAFDEVRFNFFGNGRYSHPVWTRLPISSIAEIQDLGELHVQPV